MTHVTHTDTRKSFSASSSHDIASLTWLRGLAAWAVVISHCIRALEVSYHPESTVWIPAWFSAFDLGSLGVALFFVLSGCTLYISNARASRYGSSPLATFYVKRVMRIWPAFAVSLLFYGAFRAVFSIGYGEPNGHWVETQFLAPVSFVDVVSYLTLSFNITGPGGLFNNAYWSLPVEFQYYLVFPFVVWSMNRIHWLFPVILGGTAYFLQKFGWVAIDSTLVFELAFTFFAGMIVGYLYIRWGDLSGPMKYRVPAAISIFLVVALCSLMVNEVVPVSVYKVVPSEWVFYGLSAIALVVLVLFSRLKLPAIVFPSLIQSGAISYSIYLYHNLVIGVAVMGLVHFGIESGLVRFWILVLFVFPVTWLLAVMSYRWVEQPSINTGRALSNRLGVTP